MADTTWDVSRRNRSDALPDLHRWLSEAGRGVHVEVDRVPLDRLVDWQVDEGTGNIGHVTGRFFTVEGLAVRIQGAQIERWSQPVLHQPEIGILGLLMKEFDGVPHCLLQAKAEPGLHNGRQLAPTVQATRSNYLRVHGGRQVPYLEYFRPGSGCRTVADVRQSEKGSLFYRKRNRNMVVETSAEVPLQPGFRWVSVRDVHRLLADGDIVNVHARGLLACLPHDGQGLGAIEPDDPFRAAAVRSAAPEGARHRITDILSWVTELRVRTEVTTNLMSLANAADWVWRDGILAHRTGLHFDVLGVGVRARGREVEHWMQPMVRPNVQQVNAFLVTTIGGVLHMLVRLGVEPGLVDVAELAPTVQAVPAHREQPRQVAHPYMEHVCAADPRRIKFDHLLSEEGGRLYHARNRYMIVEADESDGYGHSGYRWMTLHQLSELLRHSHYVNAQARTLITCLRSIVATP